ncbi:hypothetical protein BTVI_65929 [Pitangus sulphuratus]|nr:hypothetical protein BTVI_65929 [Pitangus sulphuratus]
MHLAGESLELMNLFQAPKKTFPPTSGKLNLLPPRAEFPHGTGKYPAAAKLLFPSPGCSFVWLWRTEMVNISTKFVFLARAFMLPKTSVKPNGILKDDPPWIRVCDAFELRLSEELALL